MKKLLICGTCTEDRINTISYFGGSAGGMALNLASLGVPVGILSVLGHDDFSQKYQQELLQRNIDTSLIHVGVDHLPVLEVINRENSEKARVFTSNGARELLGTLTPLAKTLNTYDILHITNTPKQLCDYLADTFTGTISYSPGSLLVREPSSLSLNLLEKATYLFCNEDEYAILTKQIKNNELFSSHVAFIVISQAEKGIIFKTKQKEMHIAAKAVKEVVDTTGAGDALAVGILSAIAKNEPLEIGIQKGLSFAAQIIQQEGVLL